MNVFCLRAVVTYHQNCAEKQGRRHGLKSAMANFRTAELGAQSLLLYGNGNGGVQAVLLIYFIKTVLWSNALVAIVHIKVLWPWP
jgi:hypothetical protein